jgi:hypothetical protein
MATLIYKDNPPSKGANTVLQGEDLWLPVEQLKAATGLELKPEGVCYEDSCYPLPTQQHSNFLRDDDRQFNLSAFARLLGQPIVYDQQHDVWLFGEAGGIRRDTLSSLQAPNFTLPDLEGRFHSLTDYLGKKIFLVSWASW